MTTEDNATGGVQPDSASTAATDVDTKDDVTKTEADKAADTTTAEGDRPDAATKPDDKDQAATDAAKLLADRKAQKASERQERWNKLTREKNDALRRADDLEKEVAKLKGGLKEPNPADYDDVSDLTAAKVDHTLDQREIKRLEGQTTQSRQQADAAKLEIFNAKADEAREKYDDFDDVVIKPARLPMSQDTQSIILDMDESADVIYHLAKNPAEAQRIDRLSDREKAFELGKIAAKITQPPPRKVTQAAAPIESVGGKSSGGAGFDPAKASVEDFSERYRKSREARAS
jgi:hypothetical protein